MIILKIAGKILLLPILLLLCIIRLLVKIGMEISSLILGVMILIVLGCIIFTIIQHTWNSMAILVIIEIFLILVTAGTGFLEGILQIAYENLGNYMRS